MSKVIEINAQNFENEVLNSETPILVDFFAPWCGPCQMMAPVLEELVEIFEGKVKIAKINTELEDNQALAMKYQIQSIPNMKVFKSGEVIKEFIGYNPTEILKAELDKLIA